MDGPGGGPGGVPREGPGGSPGECPGRDLEEALGEALREDLEEALREALGRTMGGALGGGPVNGPGGRPGGCPEGGPGENPGGALEGPWRRLLGKFQVVHRALKKSYNFFWGSVAKLKNFKKIENGFFKNLFRIFRILKKLCQTEPGQNHFVETLASLDFRF